VRLRRLTVVIFAVFLVGSPAAARANPGAAGIQVALRSLGLYHGAIDGKTGPETIAAVRTLQARMKLPVTGVVDARTRAAIGPLGSPRFGSRVIEKGDFGLDVSVLQILLGRRGDYHGALDGFFGPRTELAVKLFQRGEDLSVDGLAGAHTRKVLVRTMAATVRARKRKVETETYVVRPGDSLTGIAGYAGVSVSELARLNRLDPSHVLQIGTTLKVPLHAPSIALSAAPASVQTRLDYWSSQLGVSSHLVRALAWMESGYQPNVVSDVGARGVLQTLPTTRQYVETVLIGHAVPETLDGDIEIGVVYLRHLLQVFGGNEELALAGWYQGEQAVRLYGPYNVTRPFVNDVLALSTRM
jgi:peptidoglycan hydrolase-like protein with peptidoglycan-binding domain